VKKVISEQLSAYTLKNVCCNSKGAMHLQDHILTYCCNARFYGNVHMPEKRVKIFWIFNMFVKTSRLIIFLLIVREVNQAKTLWWT